MASGYKRETCLFIPQDRNYGICLYPHGTNLTLRETTDLLTSIIGRNPCLSGVCASRFLDVHQDQIESLRVSPITKQKDVSLLFSITYVTEEQDFLVKILPLGTCHRSTPHLLKAKEWISLRITTFPLPTKECQSSMSRWFSACNIALEAYTSLWHVSAQSLNLLTSFELKIFAWMGPCNTAQRAIVL